MWGNQILNINGRGLEMLEKAIELAFLQEGPNTSVKAWAQDPKQGLILFWSKTKGSEGLPAPLDVKATAEMVNAWLKSINPEDFELTGWDKNLEHDGHNSLGWRVYVEDWGGVGNYDMVVCAVKPVYLWHGK